MKPGKMALRSRSRKNLLTLAKAEWIKKLLKPRTWFGKKRQYNSAFQDFVVREGFGNSLLAYTKSLKWPECFYALLNA